MNHQRRLYYVLGVLLFVMTSISPVFAQSFRTLTPIESAYFKKVNDIIRKALPTQIGSMKLIQVGEPETDTKEKHIISDHALNKGPYVLMYDFEYGKTIDDIQAASKLDVAINNALNDGNEAKERELKEKLAKLVGEQRCYIDVLVNFDLLNFNYTKGKVESIPVKDAVAYRSLFAEDNTSAVPYVVGTFLGIGEFKSAKDQPYEGNEGGVFEVEAKKPAGKELTIDNVVFRIYGAPSIADQLIKQLDIAGLKAVLGKKLIP